MSSKHFFIFCLVLGLTISIAGCGRSINPEKPPTYREMDKKDLDALAVKAAATATREAKRQAATGAPWAMVQSSGPQGPRAVIETNKGKIVFVMFPQKAPKTVDNFIKLANTGFYNGIRWHGVIPGQLILGGDPLTKQAKPKGVGTGGPGYTIKAEFNDIKNVRGTVGMGHTQDPNSGGSQFYICLNPQPKLDGNFTVFGQVTEGLDVIDKILVGDVMSRVYIEQGEDQGQNQDLDQPQP